jgi:glycosyltransferase involved in cell wall biosynthesis
VVDVHIARVPLSLTVAQMGFRRMVLTPHTALQRFSAWPYSRAIRTLVEAADAILCASETERAVLCRTFPQASARAEVLPAGVDAAGIGAALPYPAPGKPIVAVGALHRRRRVDRAIAAIASLDPGFRLVVLGDGPERHPLRARAADLKVGTRVALPGSVRDAVLYRWLRTAHVVLALAQQESSAIHIMEALAAGAPVVASDIPVHREVVEQVDGGRVLFVSPTGSPLEVADAILEAVDSVVPGVSPILPVSLPSFDDVVDQAWSVYRRLALPAPALDRASRNGDVAGLPQRARTSVQGGRG